MSFLPGTRPAPADVARAQADKAAREVLIERFTPFILRVTTRTVGRYVRLGEDDEVSIALMAFSEAIDRFDPERGGNFLAFAETVIKRRLIDHFRREGQRREIPMSSLQSEDGENEAQMPLEAEAAISAHQERTAQEERREEIERFQEALGAFGIRLADLARLAPRHRDARAAALGVAMLVACGPAADRAQPGEGVARAGQALGMHVVTASTVTEALRVARSLAATDGMIVVCGSLFVVAEARDALHALAPGTPPAR